MGEEHSILGNGCQKKSPKESALSRHILSPKALRADAVAAVHLCDPAAAWCKLFKWEPGTGTPPERWVWARKVLYLSPLTRLADGWCATSFLVTSFGFFFRHAAVRPQKACLWSH